jgi:hypothetical protein
LLPAENAEPNRSLCTESDVTHSVAVGLYCLRMQEATFIIMTARNRCVQISNFLALLKHGYEVIFLYGNGMYESTESVSKIMQTNAD